MILKNQEGQSTVEFIMAFAFGVSFILAIFTTSLNYAKGYLVQYATFMASRAYLTSDNFMGEFGNNGAALSYAEEQAHKVFNQYELHRFDVPNSSFKINPAGATTSSSYLTVGGQTQFTMKMDPLGNVLGQNKLEIVSESFLGKEPTRSECSARVCYAITGQTFCDRNMDITLFDDGC